MALDVVTEGGDGGSPKLVKGAGVSEKEPNPKPITD